jgi:hypothetical protein
MWWLLLLFQHTLAPPPINMDLVIAGTLGVQALKNRQGYELEDLELIQSEGYADFSIEVKGNKAEVWLIGDEIKVFDIEEDDYGNIRQIAYMGRKRSQEAKEKAKIYARKYYTENQEKIKAYREKVKEWKKEYLKKYYQDNKDRLIARGKKYYRDNLKKFQKYYKERYIQDPEKNRAERREYYRKNRDRLVERNKEYRLKNREKTLKYRKAYYDSHKDKINAKAREKRKQNRKGDFDRKAGRKGDAFVTKDNNDLEVIDQSPSSSEEVQSNELFDLVRNYVESLPQNDKEIAERILEGATNKQLEKILGLDIELIAKVREDLQEIAINYHLGTRKKT